MSTVASYRPLRYILPRAFRGQVGQLLALKGDYKSLTGEDVPGSKPKKEKKKKAAPAAAKNPKAAKAKKADKAPTSAKEAATAVVKAKEPLAKRPATVQTGPLQINVVDGAPTWSALCFSENYVVCQVLPPMNEL